MQARQQHTTTLPVIGLLIAATFWGVFWYPLSVLESYGLNGIWATYYIYLGTLVIAAPLLLTRYKEFRITPLLLLGIFVFGGWCNIAFIIALMKGEIVRVILLFYLSPIWAALFARFILKEKLSKRAYFTTVLALSGAMVMLWSPTVGYPWPASSADWLALSAGFAFALANLCTRMADGVSIQVKTSVTWLGVVLISGGMILFLGETTVGQDFEGIIIALLLGALLMSFVTYCVVFGVTELPLHQSSVILIFEVVAAAVSSYLFTDERLSVFEWTGGILVIIAAYLAAMEFKNQHQQKSSA